MSLSPNLERQQQGISYQEREGGGHSGQKFEIGYKMFFSIIVNILIKMAKNNQKVTLYRNFLFFLAKKYINFFSYKKVTMTSHN